MPKRILNWSCGALILLALGAAGCGRTERTLAPDTTAPTTSDATTAEEADLLSGGAAETDGDDDGDGRGPTGRATPISGPTTITAPGHYRLIRDFDAKGDGIVITASHVRLWLGEHRLYGPGNKAGRAIVIDGAEDVKVYGGRIEHFGMGVVLVSASHCRVRGVKIQGGDETADPAAGNPPQIGVMLVNSARNQVTRNRLTDVNLGLFVRGPGSYGNRIERNLAVGGKNGLLAICYNPAPGGNPAGAHDDQVRLNRLLRFNTGIAASEQSGGNVFARNVIHFFQSAYDDRNGTNVFRSNWTRRIEP